MPTWLKGQVTLPNIALVLSMAIGVGGYLKAFDGLERRVSELESVQRSHTAADETVRIRSAVQEEMLKSIDRRLAEVADDVKELKRRP